MIDLVLAELQLVVIVGVDERGECAADGGPFGIALGIFLEQIVGVTGEASVDSASGEAAAALEFGHELPEIYAQVGFVEIFLTEACEIGEFFGDSGFFAGGELGSFEKRGGIVTLCVLPSFFDEAGQVSGPILQDFVIPRDGGVAWKIVDVGAVIARWKGDGGEIEDRRNQDDTVQVNGVALLQIISERRGTEGAVTLTD